MDKTSAASEVDPSGDLFHPWMPAWVDGETLYSLCGRYHRIAGDRLASATCKRLFGHPRAGLSHDVPGRIGWLLARSGGTLGALDEVVLGRTVLGYYLCFRPLDEQRRVIDALLVDGPRDLKARLGWLATRLGAAHPLRACEQCMADDLKRHHTPTWRLFHQLPAVWVCPHHGALLWTTGCKSNGSQRFQWVLPDDIPERARHVPALGWSDDALAQAAVVAQATASIATHWSHQPIAVADLAKTLRMGLINRGLAAPSGRLKAETIGRALTAFLSKFAEWPEAPALCVGSDAALAVIRRVLQEDGKPLHPLRYIMMATWLFGSWEEFAGACRSQRLLPPSAKADPSPTKGSGTSSSVRRAFLANLDAGAGAVTAVARSMGIDAETGLLWAEQAGRIIHRRPKILDGTARARIARGLASGQSKTVIADRHHVSVVTVTRVLLSIPGLKDRRDQRIHERREVQARLEICRCVSSHPHIGTKALRERCPAAFVWLYRHDRDWLRSQTRTLEPGPRTPSKRVDWEARDRDFARAIEAIRRGLTSNAEGMPVLRASDLVRAVPELRKKARHLARMPLTAAALAASLPRHTALGPTR